MRQRKLTPAILRQDLWSMQWTVKDFADYVGRTRQCVDGWGKVRGGVKRPFPDWVQGKLDEIKRRQ